MDKNFLQHIGTLATGSSIGQAPEKNVYLNSFTAVVCCHFLDPNNHILKKSLPPVYRLFS